jgi:hypothetical protein
MGHTNFNQLQLRNDNQGQFPGAQPGVQAQYLRVSGPFTLLPGSFAQLNGRNVTIRFLIMQEQAGAAPLIIDGLAEWTPTPATSNWTVDIPLAAAPMIGQLNTVPAPGSWSAATGSFSYPALAASAGKCRGIGQATLIKEVNPGSLEEPPFFQTLTWCVTTEVTT